MKDQVESKWLLEASWKGQIESKWRFRRSLRGRRPSEGAFKGASKALRRPSEGAFKGEGLQKEPSRATSRIPRKLLYGMKVGSPKMEPRRASKCT